MAQTDAFLDELVSVSFALDRLIADRQAGPPSHTRHERHVDDAEKLAERLVRVGRGRRRPVNPPIAKIGNGMVW